MALFASIGSHRRAPGPPAEPGGGALRGGHPQALGRLKALASPALTLYQQCGKSLPEFSALAWRFNSLSSLTTAEARMADAVATSAELAQHELHAETAATAAVDPGAAGPASEPAQPAATPHPKVSAQAAPTPLGAGPARAEHPRRQHSGIG